MNQYCTECGKELLEGQLFCAHCGASANPVHPGDDALSPDNAQMPRMQAGKAVAAVNGYDSGHIKCPQCSGRQLAPITETNTTGTTGSGYNGAAGCLGFLMFGPCGLCCGSCGQTPGTIQTKNKTFWICQTCGNKFRNLSDFREEIDRRKQSCKAGKICIAALEITIILPLLSLLRYGETGVFLLLAVFLILLYMGSSYLMNYSVKKLEADYAELERKCRV